MFKPVDHNLANPENQGNPVIRFNYQLPYSWSALCEGMLKKWNWEPRTSLTTIPHVKQIDEDTISFYRRHEADDFAGITWEQVTINRKTQEIKSEILAANNDGVTTQTVDRTVIGSDSKMTTECFDPLQNGNIKVEVFKNECAQLIKALKFNEWSNQQ